MSCNANAVFFSKTKSKRINRLKTAAQRTVESKDLEAAGELLDNGMLKVGMKEGCYAPQGNVVLHFGESVQRNINAFNALDCSSGRALFISSLQHCPGSSVRSARDCLQLLVIAPSPCNLPFNPCC
jgi:hypothetical protein